MLRRIFSGGLCFKFAAIIALLCSQLVLCLICTEKAFGEYWVPQFSPVQNREFKSVDFIDTNTGWIVGEAGIILKTTNGGNTWNQLSSPTANNLTCVDFINSTVGWIVGENGTIFKTINGGTSWSAQTFELVAGNKYILTSIFAISSTEAWITGYAENQDQAILGYIRLQTTNGGTTWSKFSKAISSATLNDIFFLNSNEGWAVGDGGLVIHTNNAGATWTLIGNLYKELDGCSYGEYFYYLKTVSFSDSNHGWITGSKYSCLTYSMPEPVMFFTNDGGISWTEKYLIEQGNGTFYAGSTFFVSPNKGWVVGTGSTYSGGNTSYYWIYRTDNGGQTWTAETMDPKYDYGFSQLNAVVFPTPTEGWTVGQSSKIFHYKITSDTDADGMLDSWEMQHFGNLSQGQNGDYDSDGLTNLQEFQLGTNPTLKDTDGDGMPDGWEVQYNLNPLDKTDANKDYDGVEGDGLTNLQEYQRGTNPRNWDTDSDGMGDGWEVQYGLNPLDPADANGDPDGDGMTNLQEQKLWTNPKNYDQPMACANAVSLFSGIPYSGTTIGKDDKIDSYIVGANSYRFPGPEVVHRITTSSTGTIKATLTNTPGSLHVVILNECNRTKGVAYGNSVAEYTNAPPGVYYIVVDTDVYNSQGGAYTLTVIAPTASVPCPTKPQTIAPKGIISETRPVFNWTAVANIDQYRLQCRNAQTKTEVINTLVQTNSYQMQNTLSQANYEWQVTALRSECLEAISGWTTFAVNSPPSTPGNISIQKLTDTTARIYWEASSDPNQTAITYKVEYNTGTGWKTEFVSNNYLDIIGLKEETKYYLSVKITAYDGFVYSGEKAYDQELITLPEITGVNSTVNGTIVGWQLFNQYGGQWINIPSTQQSAKIPLILVHGHGTDDLENSGTKYRWQKLIDVLLNKKGFFDQFDVWIWRHDSQKAIGFNGYFGNAAELSDCINNYILPYYKLGTKPVLIAHSRGGLVARSFMNYKNQGDLTHGLITLGTPHHGSPLAVPDWAAFSFAEHHIGTRLYNIAYGPTGQFDTTELGGIMLAWDNMDGVVPRGVFVGDYDTAISINGEMWLTVRDFNLPIDVQFQDQTIFYGDQWTTQDIKSKYGTLYEINQNARYLDKITTIGFYDDSYIDNFQDWDVLGALLGLQHDQLEAATMLLGGFAIEDVTKANVNYKANDGLVPIQSALFLTIENGATFSQQNPWTGSVTVNHQNVKNNRQVKRQYFFSQSGLRDHLDLLDTDNIDYWDLIVSEIYDFTPRANYSSGYTPVNENFLLDLNGNNQWNGCQNDKCIFFGTKYDFPVAGKFNGGHISQIGVFRKTPTLLNGVLTNWFLDLDGDRQWSGCVSDECDYFGTDGDLPIVGDWNNDGFDEIGVFRPSTGLFYLDHDGNGKWEAFIDRTYRFGMQGDIPVSGDWTGSGVGDRIGVFRPSNGTWYLDFNGNGQWDIDLFDITFKFGMEGDLPVTGDWNGDGKTKIGVFRPNNGKWYLDLNGNGKWDGCGDGLPDGCYTFGAKGDLPIVGDWNGDGIAEIGVFRPK
jgi:photosystem II stability/assembly factor-like uncharacterized protein